MLQCMVMQPGHSFLSPAYVMRYYATCFTYPATAVAAVLLRNITRSL